MNSPTFVLTAPWTRRSLRKSAILGRSVADRLSVVRSRRTCLPIFASLASDQATEDRPSTEDRPEAIAETPPADESTGKTLETAIEDASTETVAQDVATEVVSEDSTTEVTAEDPLVEIASEDAPAEVVVEDTPTEAVAEDAPAEVVAEDEPAEVVTEEGPTEVVAEEASTEVVAQDALTEDVVEDVSTEVVTEDASTESVVAENVVEDVAAQSDSPSTPQAEESSPTGPKGEGKKRRRRRPKKQEVTLPLEKMTVGMELEGTVKSVTEYGAFIGDMGTPTDGLLHVSQLAAGFVENVTDIVNVGEKLTVRVLSIDTEKGNFSLTKRTAEELEAESQPKGNRREAAREAAAARRAELNSKWDEFTYDPEVFVDAKVISVTDFGGFCQLVDEDGEKLESCPTDGLIHISELSKERVAQVSDILTVGEVVKVRVTATDRKRNRISLSLRPVQNEVADNGDSASVAASIASAEKNQPVFKTSFELAFERARAAANQQ